ncbi:MAG: hypothetical protein N2201_03725 [candidate division WOR-3 bacterium]|nr:hypothetical protein [candidate division WOR-3 bacterium]
MVIVSYNYTFTSPAIDTLRKAFYSIPLPPIIPEATICFDGTDKVIVDSPGFPPESTYYQVYTQHIIAAKSNPPAYNLYLAGSATTNSGMLNIKITPADTLTHSPVNAFIAICEDSVVGMTKDFNYVVRKLFNFPLYLVYPDSLDTIITFQHTLPPNKMTGVLFLQNMNTKKVLQAVKTRFR